MDRFLNKFKMLILIAGDVIILYLSLFLTLKLRYYSYYSDNIFDQHFWPFTIIYMVWLVIFYIDGIYDLRFIKSNFIFLKRFTESMVASVVIAIIFFYFIPYFQITPKTNLFLNIVIFAIIFYFWRWFFNRFASFKFLKSRLLFIGRTKETEELVEFIKDNRQFGYEVAGIIDDISANGIKERIIKEHIDMVIFSKDLSGVAEISKVFYDSLFLKVKFVDLIGFYELLTKKIPISAVSEAWFIENLKESDKKVYDFLRKILERFVAFIGFIVFVLIFPFVWIIVKIGDNGPIFYKQARVGENGKIFEIIKFRTMIVNAEKNGPQWAIAGDLRITKIGKFLRRSRLDETPQIINILRGDMSFIGPRPERPEFVSSFTSEIPFYNIRHLIKPGVTGWAQMNYKYAASKQENLEKLQYDIYYIKNRSFVLDLAIVLKTINVVLRREGQ